MSIPSSKKKLIAANVMMLLIGLILIEGSLDLFWPQPFGIMGRIDPRTNDRWNPSGTYLLANGAGQMGQVSFDENGYRVASHPHPVLKNQALPKLLILGGSLSFGWPNSESYADLLLDYNVTNCSMSLTNLATLAYMSKNQCKEAFRAPPEVLIIQVSLIPVLEANSVMAMGLFYGENLIEEPGQFYAHFEKNINLYSNQLQFRENGVPYIEDNTNGSDNDQNSSLRPNIFFKGFNTYRFFYYHLQKLNLALHHSDFRGMLANWLKKFSAVPDERLSVSLVKQIQAAVGPKTKIFILLVPNLNGMTLARSNEVYVERLEKNHRSGREAGLLAVKENLKAYRKTLENFVAQMRKENIEVVDATQPFSFYRGDEIFFEDQHHLKPPMQKLLAEILNRALLDCRQNVLCNKSRNE